MKRDMILFVRDKSGQEWGFVLRADPAYLNEWQLAGLEIHTLEAAVPAWVAAAGFAKPWAALQAAWQWVRLW